MGLFTRKKRDPGPPPPHQPSTTTSHPSPSSNHLLPIPQDDQRSTHSNHSQKSRSPKNRFHNMFRSTSHSDSPLPATPSYSIPPNPPRASFQDQYTQNQHYSGKKGKGTSSSFRANSTSEGSWDDTGIPLSQTNPLNSTQPEPLDRYRLFGGGGGQASSTLSLPVFQAEETDSRRRVSTSTARETINETIYPVNSRSQEEDHSEANNAGGGGKWSRWKMGRGGPKQRTGSMSSMRMFGGEISNGGSNNNNEEDGGFVVKSFRTVSRVHEDPVSSASPTSPPLPALPSHNSGSALSSYDQQDSQQQESIRASIDLGSSQTRRPPLNVFGPNSTNRSESSSRSNLDRAPSPSTISVEAFRLASARSKSSVSLVSLNNLDSPPLDNDRPKFEPAQRPSSRASRRQSTYSDLSVDNGSSFLPPRPRFAHHSNSSNSSIQSRKSSNHSIGSQTPPIVQPAQTREGGGKGMNPSESLMSMSSYTTAAEPRTVPSSAMSTPATSRVQSPATRSPPASPFSLPSTSSTSTSTSNELPVRPAAVKRLSSGDSELRWIASYADSITESEITTSPIAYQNPSLPFPAPRTSPASTPKSKPANSRISHTPSFSVQPPTPATVSDSSPAASPSASRSTGPNRQFPKRSSSLATDSTKAALQSMGVGGGSPRRQSIQPLSKPSPTSVKSNNQKASRAASRGWMSDSSDEDEQEALETDNSNSDSDDEVPLSQIQSRSQTDLSLPPALVQAEQRAKAELEAAAASKKAVQAAAESKLTGGGGISALGLSRRGSNRRSVSTLSLATNAMVIPTPSSAASSSTPNLAPSSPTRSILQRPHHPRSVSNPSSPFPSSASSISTAPPPPIPAIPASVADRSSSSSGTGSSSSALLTPGDLSPAVSDLGLKSHPGLPNLSKPSVKFDLAALSSQTDPARWNKGRRASAIQSSQSSVGFNHHRPTQSLQHPSSFNPARPTGPASLAPTPRGPRSSLAPSPSSNSLASSRTAVEANSAKSGGVFDRMKARHKQEAVEALKLGEDLNNPSGLVPDRGGEEDEDEDEPLANLPTRGANGSMIGGMDGGIAGGSMIGGMPYGGMGMGMGVGFGGAYSPLAIAPFGVDPYLYASLPLDQKMSLHQRSQQMMAMMQQAAMQAKAESVAGSAMGGSYGSREGSMIGGENNLRGGAGPRGRLHGASMSMSNLDSFASYGGGGQPQFNAGARLPPFAPSFAMSAPFMHPGIAAHQHQHSGSVYGVPGYANSAVGLNSPSTIGAGPKNSKGLNPGGRAASMMGFDQRR
ncbi:hypothetical protein JCM3765_002056 [Sporobolomyces pararoseus]